MDTSKPIEPSDIVKATPAEIAKLTHRHVHALYDRWRLVSWWDWQTPTAYEKDCVAAAAILKAELARRPHVPNKKEGKAIRRAAAKAKR